jgi:ArsR family transcriptional regulator, lead/cadmium/zinc/bismuth-responsive transcriptional repressor
MGQAEPDYKSLSGRFRLLGHPERLRILDVLRRGPECVCHLEALLDKPQPYISQQLRMLRKANLIQDEREGLNVFYRLADAEIGVWLDLALGPVQGEHAALAYQKRLVACPCPKCAELPAPETAALKL